MTIGIDLDDTLVNTRDLLKENWKKYIEENKIVEFTSELPDDINRFGNKIIDTFWDQYREEMAYPSLKEGALIHHLLHQQILSLHPFPQVVIISNPSVLLYMYHHYNMP